MINTHICIGTHAHTTPYSVVSQVLRYKAPNFCITKW